MKSVRLESLLNIASVFSPSSHSSMAAWCINTCTSRQGERKNEGSYLLKSSCTSYRDPVRNPHKKLRNPFTAPLIATIVLFIASLFHPLSPSLRQHTVSPPHTVSLRDDTRTHCLLNLNSLIVSQMFNYSCSPPFSPCGLSLLHTPLSFPQPHSSSSPSTYPSSLFVRFAEAQLLPLTLPVSLGIQTEVACLLSIVGSLPLPTVLGLVANTNYTYRNCDGEVHIGSPIPLPVYKAKIPGLTVQPPILSLISGGAFGLSIINCVVNWLPLIISTYNDQDTYDNILIGRPPMYILVVGTTFESDSGFMLRGHIPAGSYIILRGNTFTRGIFLPRNSPESTFLWNHLSMIAWYDGWFFNNEVELRPGSFFYIESNTLQIVNDASQNMQSITPINLGVKLRIHHTATLLVYKNQITENAAIVGTVPKYGIDIGASTVVVGGAMYVLNNTIQVGLSEIIGIRIASKLINNATLSPIPTTPPGNTAVLDINNNIVRTQHSTPIVVSSSEHTCAKNVFRFVRNSVTCSGGGQSECSISLALSQLATSPPDSLVARVTNNVITTTNTAVLAVASFEVTRLELLAIKGRLFFTDNAVTNYLGNNGNRPYYRVAVGTIGHRSGVVFHRNSGACLLAGASTFNKIIQRGTANFKENVVGRGFFTMSMNRLGPNANNNLLATRGQIFNATIFINDYGGDAYASYYSCDCGNYLTTKTCEAQNLVCDYRGTQDTHVVCLSNIEN